MVSAPKPTQRNQLHELGYKIFLDRYAQKDMNRTTLAVGDTVIVVVDSKTGQREIGTVKAIDLPQVTIALNEGEIVTRDLEHVDKPLETDPAQMQARVAQGIAQAEATPELREQWAKKFEWLLDDFKFVPAGRILAAAGTDQLLTFYNCYVVPSPKDSRNGIIETLRQMTEIMSRGGGVGINISSLRPRHAYVKGVNGRSSGAVSWGALYSFVTGLIEQGGCFGPNERILTDKGLIPAAELAERMDAGETFHAHTHEGPRPITARFRNGVKPLYDVTTERGYKVQITADHKVAVYLDGQIVTMALRYLVPGDEILLLLGQGVEADHVPLKPSTYADERSIMSTRLNEDVRLPATLNEELAYLIGYSYGDGYVQMGKKVTWQAPKALSLATADAYPDIRAKLITAIRNQFGLEPSVEMGDGALANVKLYSRLVIEWLIANDLLKPKADAIRVPEAIFRSPSSVQAAFIAGYFDADGCNRGRKGGYGIDSISRDMLADVQKLLALNGIVSRIGAADRSAQGWQTLYRLTVTGARFKSRFVEFVPTLKASADNGFREESTYPAEVFTALNVRSKYRQRIWDGVSSRIGWGQMERIGARLSASGETAAAAQIDHLLNTLPDKIVSITPVGDSDVYDFEVDTTHLISGNGIYTSNSRRGALMLILDDWHPDVFDFINSKREAGKITNANISVGVSDRLMELIKTDGDWPLIFPDSHHPQYDEEWDGNIEAWQAKGYPVITHRTVKARDVWDAIIESAWASAEPGVFFRERYNKMSNSWYHSPIIATNPCTTGSTLVSTEHGYTRARDLQVGMKIRTPAGLKPIEKIYNNGVQKIYRVRLSDGGFLDATADHKLKVVRGKKYEWVALSDLQIGDKVAVSANPAFGKRRLLPPEAAAYVQKRKLDVAPYFDRRLGFLIGAALGDGTLRQLKSRDSYSNSLKMAFGTKEERWLETFETMVEDMGIHTHRYVNEKDIAMPDGTLVKHRAISLDCYKLATLLVKLGLPPNVKAPQKRIPRRLMALDRRFLAGLLDGLFSTDGNVLLKRDNPMLRFTTASHALAQQVRLILLQFGIHGRIYRSERKATTYDGRSMIGIGHKYDVVIMNEGIAKFYSHIGLTNPMKAERIKDVAENWHFIGGSWLADVVSVKDTGREEEVFDVYEPHTLTWVTNGYISLDCGEQGLPGFGVCNLGAINLAKFYDEDKHDVKWDDLDQAVRYATRFLDNVIDSTPYFFDENAKQQLGERRVGLNNMGLAELMIRLGIRYGSDESVAFIDRLYSFIARASYETSAELAAEKGAFPLFDADKFLQSGFMESMPDDIRDTVRRKGIRNVTLLTQAPTGCVAPDTLVSLDTGMQPIVSLGDATGSQWQPLTRGVHTDQGLRQTSHFYINGRMPVKRVTTERGFTLTATPNHRIRVIDADGGYVWRRMDELAPGDRVVLKKNTLSQGAGAALQPVEQGNRALSDLPSTMTPDLAELLGLYMGDGYTKARGGLHIVVAKRDPDLLDHVQRLLQRVWPAKDAGETRVVAVEDRQGCWVANLTGYYIRRFFEVNGMLKPAGNHGEGAAGAFIPDAVLASGRQAVIAFLRGLFETDGGITRGTVTLSSTSDRLLAQVQVALLGLGIVSTRRQMPEQANRYGTRPFYELRLLNRREVQKFVELIGFISERKQAACQELGAISDRGDSIPVTALCEDFYAQSAGLGNPVRQRIIGLVSNGALTQQFVRTMTTQYPQLAGSRLGQLVSMDIFLDSVASIADGVSDTFDLSVPDNHTYIANGFVSHNTTGTMVNTSTGIEPFFSWVYYRKSRLGLHEEQVPLVKDWYEAHPDATELPDHFVTAMDLAPEEHVKVQAAIQRWVDSSISKTSNLPNHYTVDQTRKLYEYMYELGCKGGTVYRDGSRDEQVLMLKGDERAESEMSGLKKEAVPQVDAVQQDVGPTATPHRVWPRPKRLTGVTVSTRTGFGTAYITMNSDENGYPFEVFITAPGKAGSDLQADAEGLGRMISLQLRTTAPVNRMQMLKLIIDQLKDIGGARSYGMGPNRVLSLPDAVAGALMEQYFRSDEAQQLSLFNGGHAVHEEEISPTHIPVEDAHAASNGHMPAMAGADICPSCGTVSLIRAEGCRKCLTCGYSEC